MAGLIYNSTHTVLRRIKGNANYLFADPSLEQWRTTGPEQVWWFGSRVGRCVAEPGLSWL